MNNEVIFLVVGASIALVSGIVTTLFTSYLEYRTNKRAKIEEKEEQAYHLMGRMSVFTTDEQTDSAVIAWQEQSKLLDEFLQVNNHDSNKLSGLIGLIEAGLEKLEKFREKNDKLESEVKRLLNESIQLENEIKELEDEARRLEDENKQLEDEQIELRK